MGPLAVPEILDFLWQASHTYTCLGIQSPPFAIKCSEKRYLFLWRFSILFVNSESPSTNDGGKWGLNIPIDGVTLSEKECDFNQILPRTCRHAYLDPKCWKHRPNPARSNLPKAHSLSDLEDAKSDLPEIPGGFSSGSSVIINKSHTMRTSRFSTPPPTKRVGRPKVDWTWETQRNIWDKLKRWH